MSCDLKNQVQEDMKSAMRAKEVLRLSTIRMLLAAIKQIEIDDRKVLTDSDVELIIIKMIKQRRDSHQQFQAAGRDQLAEKEQAEIVILETYLPEPLSTAEVEQLISDAINNIGASSMRDMGKVMAELKPIMQGRTDMSQVSRQVKEKLEG